MTNTAETGATVLLPCPFCGGAPVMMGIPPRRAPEQWVKCTECGASSDTTSGAKRASEKWNTRAVNRDARFTDMVAALEHALVRFRCLEDQFEESGDTASWAMCSVDADRIEKILSSIKASTS